MSSPRHCLNVYKFASHVLRDVESSVNPATVEIMWSALSSMYAEPWLPGGQRMPPWQSGVVSCELAIHEHLARSQPWRSA